MVTEGKTERYAAEKGDLREGIELYMLDEDAKTREGFKEFC
jgi:hypothetical protein